MDPEIQSKLLRWGMTVGGVVVVALNKKLGLNLGVEDLAVMASLIVGAVSGSNWKEAKLAGHDAAVKIAGVTDAAAVLGATPAEYKP